MQIVAINGSTRAPNNSGVMVHALLRGLSYKQIQLADYQVNEIIDQRHEKGPWQSANDDYPQLIGQLTAADWLIFATPVYWYGVSGLLKTFMDRWSESLATDEAFKSKLAAKRVILLIAGSDEPKRKAKPIISEFNYVCDFLDWQLVAKDTGAVTRLGELNQRLQTLN
ncbi:NAD(P)H-dependent oxidoreductase [Lentilactobacillus fungorum]|uniref:NAD(P)H-dependent oxidoreductase n=1 Tax=Lentilactobacillus fungorum TaxID=2201250 RepID=A0ABQ3W0I9_9LACO|nr:flavodoxin family protein [Lentilactobacillus fungorum]GHP13194.1 NAD(P)H-dependent oxidoreductase [Lentilactobacillus fungorum]